MTQLMKTIGKVQRQLNPSLKIDGVLLTLADMRTKLARTTEDSLRENYGKHIRIFKTVIPVAITAAESSAAGQSIYEYDKNGTVAKAYAEFTREVLKCCLLYTSLGRQRGEADDCPLLHAARKRHPQGRHYAGCRGGAAG